MYSEHEKKIFPLLIKHQIIGCFRYVENILLIYDQRNTNIEEALTEYSKLQPTMKFSINKELHNTINFIYVCNMQETYLNRYNT
jgi:hypothetical protein